MFSMLIGKLLKSANKRPENEPESMNDIKIEATPELITLNDYLTSSGQYPARANSPECTQQVKDNAKDLIKRVTALLIELKVTQVKISSGFRTSEANNSTSNAAKKSNHMTGSAIDILDDKDQSLCKKVTKELLIKYNLYREDSNATKGKNTNWCHLQITPTKSGSRIFNP